MNIIHLKYAVEIANTGSINKAAENLLMAQPNLSRSIKELESDLGIAIFDRTSKGMILTPAGEELIGYARKILSEIEYVENIFKKNAVAKQSFSISVPRASYISEAFTNFSKSLSKKPCEIFYKETNSLRAIKNILTADYKLGIIRYSSNYDSYFKDKLEEKGLDYELITEFHYLLVTSAKSKLASKKPIHFSDLKPFIEIAHADPYVPSLPLSFVKKEELPEDVDRRIFVFERGSQFELLSENLETYMWVSPLPDKVLKRFNLIQIDCADNHKSYKDVLIFKKDYKKTQLDKDFITELCLTKRKYLGK